MEPISQLAREAVDQARRGAFGEALATAGRALEQHPGDARIHLLIGKLHWQGDRRTRALDHYRSAVTLAPDAAAPRLELARALMAIGELELAAALLDNASQAADELTLLRARVHDLLGHPREAVRELERALEANPRNAAALTALAQLHERQNRIEELAEDLRRLEDVAPESERLGLLRAQLAYRREDFEGALALAEATPAPIDAATRAELIGHCRDRLGDSGAAWAAFELMNRVDAREFAGAADEARGYRARLGAILGELTEEWASRWTAITSPAATPAFLVGFPGSGAMLLDTFLMGNPGIAVAEEKPMIPEVAKAAGPLAELPTLGQDAVENLRRRYFALADKYVPERGGDLLVDKFPLGLVGTPQMHRLFPAAPFLFVQRHPCDVVLSCFFSRVQPAGAAANFLDIVETARLYDGMMSFWTRCRELLPLRVHTVRYERLVENPAAELRAAANFLGLGWYDFMMENRATAERRGFNSTSSYAHVADPAHARSVERWHRYPEHMGEAIDVVAPWAERFGYEL